MNRVVLDFLNFIFPQEIHIESLHGVSEKRKSSEENIPEKPQQREEVKIIYPYAFSKMFKPTVRTGVPIFPYNNVQENSIQPLSEELV